MLPPKVARMMVNIAGIGTILDPFCGVGTILAEAFTVGDKIIGADINPKQIEKTRKNLDWLGAKYQLFISDARKISQELPPNSLDAIVTEPYLGPDEHQKLEKLYQDSLADWKKILKPGGKVVIALPFAVDKAKIMGYSLSAGPFPYFRPQAKIKRNIYVWHILKHQE
jgi:tRNA (guanine10-N2)-dimethyltransferase